MTSDRVVGLGRFSNKVLISSRRPHRNMVMRDVSYNRSHMQVVEILQHMLKLGVIVVAVFEVLLLL